MKGRLEVFEGYISRRVEEEMEREWDEVLRLLEEHLPREEFANVVRILAHAGNKQR
jgi:hypothetical protein